MERIRNIKIEITIETNKMDYHEIFDDLDEAALWVEKLDIGITYMNNSKIEKSENNVLTE